MLKDNRGYALVTVLMVITVFIVISLAFFGNSISTMNQSSAVEKKAQSVEAAEMGSEYFRYYIFNNVNSVINNIEDSDIQDAIVQEILALFPDLEDLERGPIEDRLKDKNNKIDISPFLTDDFIKPIVANYVKREIINNFSKTTLEEPINSDNKEILFKIEEIEIRESGDDIKITANSIGKVRDKNSDDEYIETDIKNTHFIPANVIKNLITTTGSGGGNPLIERPNPTNVCTNKTIKIENHECKITGTYKPSGKGNADAEIINSKVLVEGKVHITNPKVTHLDDEATLYVTGDYDSTGNTSLKITNNSKLYVGGKFDTRNKFPLYLDNYSVLHIVGSGDLLIKGTVNIGNGSTVFIEKNTVIRGVIIDSNSKLCVRGNLDIQHQSGGNDRIFSYNINPERFESECNQFSSGDGSPSDIFQVTLNKINNINSIVSTFRYKEDE